MRQTSTAQLQAFIDALSTRVPQDFSVRAEPIFNQEWIVRIESATQTDAYHVDLSTLSWVRYV